MLLLAAAVLLGPSAYTYYSSQGPLPGGVTLGGMKPSGDTLEAIARNLHEALQQPVAVYFDDERIILQPSEVDFQVDVNAMIAQAVPLGQGLGFWRPFLGDVFDRPADPVDIPPGESRSQFPDFLLDFRKNLSCSFPIKPDS